MKSLLILLLTLPFSATSQTSDWIFGVTINDPRTKILDSYYVKEYSVDAYLTVELAKLNDILPKLAHE